MVAKQKPLAEPRAARRAARRVLLPALLQVQRRVGREEPLREVSQAGLLERRLAPPPVRLPVVNSIDMLKRMPKRGAVGLLTLASIRALSSPTK